MGAAALASPVALGTAAASARPGGPVEVYYAASLTKIMEDQLGPAFDKATGYHFVGFPGESKAIAAEIRARLVQADVFVSASPAVDRALEGRSGGDFITRVLPFGRAYLELGYDPKSRFAARLRARPWWAVVALPGFRLGRTDPSTDPKGVLAVEALDQAARAHHLPALAKDATDPAVVFPEASLVGRVTTGQLDAGFFYSVEAVAAHLPAVGLGAEKLFASYTVAALANAPHPAGARAFASFLLGRKAQALLRRDGMAAP
jgi:molybdate/tungstate transport system substrate-binding protein